MRLHLEIQNEERETLMYRDYTLEDGVPKLLAEEVQEMLDVIKDSNK